MAYERKDAEYRQAKKSGVRSRAYYKLQELNQKHKLLKQGFSVLDLGAWPGSWIEYVHRKVGSSGLVVGVDLAKIDEFAAENIKTLQGDLSSEETIDQIIEISPKYDLVISDMSPKLSGIVEADRAKCIHLAELALYIAQKCLKTGGNLVIKVFNNNETEDFIRENRKNFNKIVKCNLKSTRRSSKELYLIGFGLKR